MPLTFALYKYAVSAERSISHICFLHLFHSPGSAAIFGYMALPYISKSLWGETWQQPIISLVFEKHAHMIVTNSVSRVRMLLWSQSKMKQSHPFFDSTDVHSIEIVELLWAEFSILRQLDGSHCQPNNAVGFSSVFAANARWLLAWGNIWNLSEELLSLLGGTEWRHIYQSKANSCRWHNDMFSYFGILLWSVSDGNIVLF